MRRRGILGGLVAVSLLLGGAGIARADFQYVKGQEATAPGTGVCPGIGEIGTAGYQRNTANVDPRKDETFFLDVRLRYFSSFDCAASFTGIRVTLPANLVPATGGVSRVVCQRYLDGSNFATTDPRAGSNCPAVPASLGGTLYSLDPATTSQPDKPFASRNYWFLGYDGARSFSEMRLLVPVVSSAAITGQPVTFTFKRFDEPASFQASVNVTVRDVAQPGNGGTFVPATLSTNTTAVGTEAGQLQISPIGIQFPFSIVKGSTTFGEREKTVAGNRSLSQVKTDAANPSCSSTPGNTGDFSEDQSGVEVLGDFIDPFTVAPYNYAIPQCDLLPEKQYTTMFCAIFTGGAGEDCDIVTYRTPGVKPDLAVTLDANDARNATFSPTVPGGHPAGDVRVLLTNASGTTSQAGSSVAVVRSAAAVATATQALTGLAPYASYSAKACFDPTGTPGETCGPAQAFVTGRLDVPGPATTATSIGFTGITFRKPSQAATLQLRLAPSSNGLAPTDAATLPVAGTAAIPVASGTGTATAPDLSALGLAPATTYAYAVCVDTGGTTAPEYCKPGATAKTSSVGSHTVTTSPATAISRTGATIDGTVAGAHNAGTLRLLLRKGTGAEQQVSSEVLPGAATDAARSIVLAGLTAGSDYSFRACFTGSPAPEECSSARSFRTLDPLVAPAPSAGTLALATRAKVKKGAKRIAVGSVACGSTPCAVAAELTATPKVARLLGIKVKAGAKKPVRVGRLSAAVAAKQTLALRLKPHPNVVRFLGKRKKARKATLEVVLSASGAKTVSKRLTFTLKSA